MKKQKQQTNPIVIFPVLIILVCSTYLPFSGIGSSNPSFIWTWKDAIFASFFCLSLATCGFIIGRLIKR